MNFVNNLIVVKLCKSMYLALSCKNFHKFYIYILNDEMALYHKTKISFFLSFSK